MWSDLYHFLYILESNEVMCTVGILGHCETSAFVMSEKSRAEHC